MELARTFLGRRQEFPDLELLQAGLYHPWKCLNLGRNIMCDDVLKKHKAVFVPQLTQNPV